MARLEARRRSVTDERGRDLALSGARARDVTQIIGPGFDAIYALMRRGDHVAVEALLKWIDESISEFRRVRQAESLDGRLRQYRELLAHLRAQPVTAATKLAEVLRAELDAAFPPGLESGDRSD